MANFKFIFWTLALHLTSAASQGTKSTDKEGVTIGPVVPIDNSLNDICSGPGKVVADPADIHSLRVTVIFLRHGERAPIYVWPTDPYNNLIYWPEGWGEETEMGKEQSFTTGKYLRQRYANWIPRKFTPQAIYTLSSDVDRTIMAGNAALAGLFPPSSNDLLLGNLFKQQFVPVHTIPYAIDNKIRFTANCDRYNEDFNQLSNSDADIAFNAANKELYEYLSEHTGINVTDYNTVYEIYDTLLIETCHNLPLPEWTRSVFPDKMRPSVVRYFQAQTWTDEMRRLFTGPLWTTVIADIEQAPAFAGQPTPSNSTSVDINAPPPPLPNLYMFSGHDNTIAGILDSFGALEQLGVYTEIPNLGSTLLLEVHESGSSGDFFVKLFFRNDINQKAREIALHCPSNPCTYPEFLDIVGKYKMTQEQWDSECSLTR